MNNHHCLARNSLPAGIQSMAVKKIMHVAKVRKIPSLEKTSSNVHTVSILYLKLTETVFRENLKIKISVMFSN